MNQIRIRAIRTERDYSSAVKRIEVLLELNPPSKSPEADELDVLTDLVEAYEDKHVPRALPSLAEAIEFRADQAGLSQQHINDIFGGSGRRSEVLSGKRQLSKAMARRLQEIGISNDVIVRHLLGAAPERSEKIRVTSEGKIPNDFPPFEGRASRTRVEFTDKQQVILDYLGSRAPALAPAYAALVMIGGGQFPLAETLLCHLGRDLIHKLPAALASRDGREQEQSRDRIEYSQRLRKIKERMTTKSTSSASSVTIEKTAYDDLVSLLRDMDEQSRQPSHGERLLSTLLLPEETPSTIRLAVERLEDLRRFFDDYRHLRTTELSESERREIFAAVQEMETLLSSFMGGTAYAKRDIDAWLTDQDPARIRSILPSLAIPSLARYFWSKLTNPRVIPALAQAKLLIAPEPVDLGNGRISYPNAPALQCLARLTADAPDETVSIFELIDTKNPLVLQALIEAAMAAPPTHASRLLEVVLKHLRKPIRPFIENELIALLERVIAIGLADEAWSLLDRMLSVKEGENGESRLILLDNHDILEKEFLAALKAISCGCGDRVVKLLSDRIAYLLRVRDADHHAPQIDSAGLRDDYSVIWLPSLEDEDGERRWKIEACFTYLLREAISAAVFAGGIRPMDVVVSLRSHRWLLLERMALYIIGEFGSQLEAEQVMLNAALFDDVYFRNEIARLFRKHFGKMSFTQQEVVFGWIDAGPKDGAIPADAITRWRLDKLQWIEEHLSGDRKRQYLVSIAKHGRSELADRAHRVITRWGDRSPITVDELSEKPIADAIRYLESWQPTTNWDAPTRDGLSAVLKATVLRAPGRWAAIAGSLDHLHPRYLCSIITALEEALKTQEVFDWNPVMALLAKIARGGLRLDEDETGIARWIRSSVVDCLAAGMRDGLPYRLRPQVTEMLRHMANDDSKSAIVGEKSLFARDHVSDALNSPRGKVAIALCEMIRWVAKCEGIKLSEPRTKVDSAGIADALSVIEQHLRDRQSENAPVLAAYGCHASNLYWADPERFRAYAASEFKINVPSQESEADVSWAFWLAFLQYHNPHREWLELFHDNYSASIAWLSTPRSRPHLEVKGIPEIGHHIVAYYWQGLLDIDQGGLVALFFATAGRDLRLRTMAYVGQSLMNTKTSPPAKIVRRLEMLWDWFWITYGQADFKADIGDRSERHAVEATFGAWYASGRLNKTWALERLGKVLALHPGVEPADDVMNRLESDFRHSPLESLELIRCLLLGDQHGWKMHIWEGSLNRLVKRSLKANDPDVKAACRRLIDLLVRSGHLGFSAYIEEGQ